jgi:hypothetical protein
LPRGFSRGDEPRGFCDGRGQKAVFVARHEVIGTAAFGNKQQKIIRWIGGSLHARQRIDILGKIPDLFDQAAGRSGRT